MALIRCPECDREISDKAETCPRCGYPIQNKPNNLREKKTKIITIEFYAMTGQRLYLGTTVSNVIQGLSQSLQESNVSIIDITYGQAYPTSLWTQQSVTMIVDGSYKGKCKLTVKIVRKFLTGVTLDYEWE